MVHLAGQQGRVSYRAARSISRTTPTRNRYSSSDLSFSQVLGSVPDVPLVEPVNGRRL